MQDMASKLHNISLSSIVLNKKKQANGVFNLKELMSNSL